jgi:hypothetical protein
VDRTCVGDGLIILYIPQIAFPGFSGGQAHVA